MIWFWIVIGLSIWFYFGYRAGRNLKELAGYNQEYNGKRQWSGAAEVGARFGIVLGGFLWITSKIAKLGATKSDHLKSWF